MSPRSNLPRRKVLVLNASGVACNGNVPHAPTATFQLIRRCSALQREPDRAGKTRKKSQQAQCVRNRGKQKRGRNLDQAPEERSILRHVSVQLKFLRVCACEIARALAPHAPFECAASTTPDPRGPPGVTAGGARGRGEGPLDPPPSPSCQTAWAKSCFDRSIFVGRAKSSSSCASSQVIRPA